MSIAEDLREARQAKQLKGQAIAILDIERIPGAATVPFWSLGDYKNRRIHADHVTQWPRTICFAAKWYGEKRVEFASEWGDGKAEMLLRAWNIYDRADVVVGHNLLGFDTKHLKSEWRDLGFAPPRPFKVVDTLAVARREFGDESKTLDAMSKRLGLEGKNGAYSATDAALAIAGDKPAQRRLERYNKADVLASEKLYDALRGWMPSHPHVIRGTDELRCPQCGSSNLDANGDTQAVVLTYPLYRCLDCGGNVKTTANSGRVANTRGVS